MKPDYDKQFIDIINHLAPSRQTWEVFSDFVELCAISISQSVHYQQDREDQYMRTISKYSHDEAQKFPELLAITIKALEEQYCDFLGNIFMKLELGNHWVGQFFTPYNLCQAMAKITFNKKDHEDGKIITAWEPAVGSGAMIIALCEEMRIQGINYQQQLRVTVQDISWTAVCMCYIQLSLIGCNAIVCHGDTLSLKEYSRFITPMTIINGDLKWTHQY